MSLCIAFLLGELFSAVQAQTQAISDLDLRLLRLLAWPRRREHECGVTVDVGSSISPSHPLAWPPLALAHDARDAFGIKFDKE